MFGSKRTNPRSSYMLFLFLIMPIMQLAQVQMPSKEINEDSVEQKIERVINNLQIETAFLGRYDKANLIDRMTYYHTPGISIAVINEGQIEWAKGYGVKDLSTKEIVNLNTLFQAGSVSKPIFSLAVLLLKYQNKIDIDKDVNDYLTSWKVPSSNSWQPKVTLRQILSHSAGFTVFGFPGYMTTEEIPTIPQILKGTNPANTAPVVVNILPGSRSRYSGGGFTVAQLVLTDYFNKPFPQIMDEVLFSPLKLTNSTFDQPIGQARISQTSTGHPWKNQPVSGKYHIYPEMAAAGLWTTPSDLANITVEIQKASKGKSDLIPKELVDEMFTPQMVEEAIGLGFWLSNEGDSIMFEHDGDDEGFITVLAAYRFLGKGAVIMINSNEGESMIYELLRSIAEEYDWPDKYKEDRTSLHEIDRKVLLPLAGRYISDIELECEILVEGDELYLKYLDQSPIKLMAQSEYVFSSQILNLDVEFERLKNKIIGFELIQGSSRRTFIKH